MYLLGQLAEDRREEVEKRLLIDDDYVDEISMAEEELIDDYVRGVLDQRERAQFELNFLTTSEQSKKVAFARSLNRYIQAEPVGKPVKPVVTPEKRSRLRSFLFAAGAQGPALRLAYAAAALIILAGATWLAIRLWQQQHEPAPTVAEQPTTQPTEQPSPPQIAQQNNNAASNNNTAQAPDRQNKNAAPSPAPPEPSRPVVATFVLTPGGVRSGGQTPKVVLQRGAKSVRLRLAIDDSATTYRATLLSDQGTSIFSSDSLRARTARDGKSVLLEVSADALSDGDYRVKLSAARDGRYEDVATYYFRVEKR